MKWLALVLLGISLQWQSGGADTWGFNLYRDGVLIASPSGLTYMDNNVNPGQCYYYQISAFNNVGESARADFPVYCASPAVPNLPKSPSVILVVK